MERRAGCCVQTCGEFVEGMEIARQRTSTCAVYVDGFDPASQSFTSFELPSPGAAVRQTLGRPGEIWGAESAVDKIVVIRISPQ